MFDMTLYLNEFLMVIFAMFLAVISPGPDFAFVLKQSITYGKRISIYTSIGIGLGISVHVIYTILGIGLIISKSIILFNIIKFLGAGYLIYIGYKTLSSSSFNLDTSKLETKEDISEKKAFVLGFLCNALNPKATLFFVSLFTVIISIDTPLVVQTVYGIVCIIITTGWFVSLSILLSHDKIRTFFALFGKWFDKTVGVALIAIGLKIAITKS